MFQDAFNKAPTALDLYHIPISAAPISDAIIVEDNLYLAVACKIVILNKRFVYDCFKYCLPNDQQSKVIMKYISHDSCLDDFAIIVFIHFIRDYRDLFSVPCLLLEIFT